MAAYSRVSPDGWEQGDDGSAFSRASPDGWEQSPLGGGGDVTAPVLSSPTGVAAGSATATIGATTDEANGTLYGFVSTSATPPSGAALKAGTGAVWAGSATVSSTGANTLNASGLSASTAYYAHLLHTDASANDSNIVTSSQFTTNAAGVAPPLFRRGGPSNVLLTRF